MLYLFDFFYKTIEKFSSKSSVCILYGGVFLSSSDIEFRRLIFYIITRHCIYLEDNGVVFAFLFSTSRVFCWR